MEPIRYTFILQYVIGSIEFHPVEWFLDSQLYNFVDLHQFIVDSSTSQDPWILQCQKIKFLVKLEHSQRANRLTFRLGRYIGPLSSRARAIFETAACVIYLIILLPAARGNFFDMLLSEALLLSHIASLLQKFKTLVHMELQDFDSFGWTTHF